MAQYESQSLYDFLIHTPEGGLRKMLVDKKNMTDVHLNLLLKVVRAGDSDAFSQHLEKQDFPRVRFGPAEEKIKEKFWSSCIATLLERGLLQSALPGKGEKMAA